MKLNGLEIKKFTVFYRCKGVDKVLEVLKNLESARVDESVLDEISSKILRGDSKFNVKVKMVYKDVNIEFDEPVEIYVKTKMVEDPKYVAISTAPNKIRVVADVNPEFVKDLCKKIANHIPKALGLKNAVDFFDPDAVKERFKDALKIVEGNVSDYIVKILRDFVDLSIEMKNVFVIARDCSVLKSISDFKGVVIVTDCPIFLDKILERVRASKLSSRELKKIGMSKKDVIKEISLYIQKEIS